MLFGFLGVVYSVEHGYIEKTENRKKGKWWLCGHYDKKENYLEFSFRDYGVGLRKTLEYNSDDKVKSFFRSILNTRLLLKPFSIFGYMSLRSYFNLKYKSNFNITKI